MATEQPNGAVLVLSELRESVLWLTLNRPEQRNPLSSAMIAELCEVVRQGSDNPSVRVIAVKSTGPVFCAGHDLKEMRRIEGESQSPWEARVGDILEQCSQLMQSIMSSPKAVIACVEGTATAAGCQLVSACDLAIASERAWFCTPGVNIGGFCTTPLVGIGRNIHRKHAMELALTGDMFGAEDACRFGLVNHVVAHDQFAQASEALARRIASKSAQGIRAGKAAFYRQLEMPVEEASRYASEEMVRAMTSAESEEGVNAFLEKRTPHWGDA